MTPEELEKFIHRELRALPTRKAPAGFEARLQAAVEARTAALPGRSAGQLEQVIHRELRGLPPRRAPRTLEARVLAEIERRASIAWYHKSWSYWPAPVRVAFMAVGTAVASAAVIGFYLLSQGAAVEAVGQEVANGFGWVTRLVAAGTWVVNFTRLQIAAIPPLWLYGGVTFIVAMYATFVGLGATAYRYLYRNN
jgi:glutathione S-transferase